MMHGMRKLVRVYIIGMRQFITAGVALFALSACAAASDPITIFTHVHVVPMDQERVLENHAVMIEGNRITAVLPMAELDVPANATIVDGEQQYLMPGLSEMHGHVPPRQSERFPERYLDDVLFLYLAGGVTTVRGMLGHPDQLQLKEDVVQGRRLGPNLYLAGPSFNGNSVTSTEQARQMVRSQASAGWDLLKIHPGLNLEEFAAVADEAERQGLNFAGHIPDEVPLDKAMQLGIRTIDHMDGYLEFIEARDRAISDDELRNLAHLTRQYDVGVVPTQALWATLIGATDPEQLRQYPEARYMPVSVREGWEDYLANLPGSRYYTPESAAVHQQNRQRLLAALHHAGVEILMGTDAPQVYSVPGLGLRHELKMMADAGLSPYEVLATGTKNVGRYFADQDTFGLVAEGHRADLILLAENPLEQLSTVSQPQGVFIHGQWHSGSSIGEKLDAIKAAYH